MKKIFAMILCLIMVCSLAACGKDSATGETGAETATATESVPQETVAAAGEDRLEATVVFGHNLTDEQVDSINHRLELFYARFPGVKVVFKHMDGEVTAENAPTVLLCTQDQIPGYLEADLLMPMDGWINTRSGIVLYADGNMGSFGLTSTEKDDLIPMYYEEGKQFGDNVTYSMPFMRHSLVMYYNGTFFSENELSETAFSWEELIEVCREIKAMDSNSVPLAIADVDETFISLCAQADIPYDAEQWQSLFGEEAMTIAKELNKLYQEGLLTTNAIRGEDVDLEEKEGTPRSYVVIGSTARAVSLIPEKDRDAYAYEVGVMGLGRISDENPRVLTYGSDLAICTADDDDLLTAAWLLVKFMCTDPAFQGGMASDVGCLPVLTSPSVPGSGDFSDYLDRADESVGLPALAALKTQDQDGAYFTAPAFTGSAKIREQLDALINQCLTFTGDVDTQIAQAFEAALTACTQ